MNQSSTGEDACWLDGTRNNGNPAWAVIKQIVHTTWYMVWSSMLRKPTFAYLVAALFLFSPADLNPKSTSFIENYEKARSNHIIVDQYYRLNPEIDAFGMVGNPGFPQAIL